MADESLDKLAEVAGMGLKAANLIGSVAEIVKSLQGDNGSDVEGLLTGDPVADAAVLRAKGVEEAIKNKFSVDSAEALELLKIIVDVGKSAAGLFA